MYNALLACFTRPQLGLIEATFEGDTFYAAREGAEVDRPAILAWRERFPDDDTRLRAICDNIIRNEGVFNYEDLP